MESRSGTKDKINNTKTPHDLFFKGWISCGGQSGLLKVLKLDPVPGLEAKLMVELF